MKRIIALSLAVLSLLIACDPDSNSTKPIPNPADKTYLTATANSYIRSDDNLEHYFDIQNVTNEMIYPVYPNFIVVDLQLDGNNDTNCRNSFYTRYSNWNKVFYQQVDSIAPGKIIHGYIHTNFFLGSNGECNIWSGKAEITFYYKTASGYQDSIKANSSWTR